MASAITVDQQKLVLNAFASIFQNNLVASDAVTWKQYDTELDDKNGLRVSEQVTPRYTVTQTVNGVNNLSAGVQDSVFGSEQFTVNRVFGTSMGWSDFVKIRDIGEARESQALRMAAINLAEAVDSYILSTIQTASNNWLGNPANGIATWSDFVQGYTRLKEEGVDDSNLRGILTYADKQALGSAIQSLTAPDALVTGAYRQGFTGEIGGLPVMFTQQLQSQTTGTRPASGANVNVNGATQNVDYKAVSASAAPGQFMTQTLNIRVSAGGTETVAAGDVFTIAGVFAFDNRAQVSTGRLQQFTVVSGGTAVAGAVTVRIFPAIIVPGVGSTADDQNVNRAHGTVDSVPANGALITFIGNASTVVRPRVILQKDAIVVNTAPLIMPATGKAMNKTLTKIPLTFRMWQHSDFNTGNHSVRFDAALTANIRDRRRIVRINGN